jgi:hypothetical protein
VAFLLLGKLFSLTILTMFKYYFHTRFQLFLLILNQPTMLTMFNTRPFEKMGDSAGSDCRPNTVEFCNGRRAVSYELVAWCFFLD